MHMQTGSDAHLKCASEHCLPEVRAECAFVEAQHAYCDRADLIVTICKKAAVTCVYGYEVTLSRIALDLGDGTREHPWVKSQK